MHTKWNICEEIGWLDKLPARVYITDKRIFYPDLNHEITYYNTGGTTDLQRQLHIRQKYII